MIIMIRLLAFVLIGLVMGISGYNVITWQFWALIVLGNITYFCGRKEEYNKRYTFK